MVVSKQKTSTPTGVCLFDLDGTLASTSKDLCSALNRMLQRRGMNGVDESDRALCAAISKGGRAMIAHGFGIPPAQEGESEEMDALFEEFMSVYEEGLCVHTHLFDGLLEQLEDLRDRNIALGVVTNKREAPARRLLEELNVMDFFPVLIGGDSLAERKPHPLPMLHAIETLGGAPAASVMVGDSGTDTRGAQNAGIKSVVVTFGYSDVPVETLGADVILDDYRNLSGALERLNIFEGDYIPSDSATDSG
ncbi:MAG: HAD-IA family hydrolase [Hyphomicrobiales bacterium]|nr:HAD-IA family hydrolase [Hyphomicrobiales bacterium]